MWLEGCIYSSSYSLYIHINRTVYPHIKRVPVYNINFNWIGITDLDIKIILRICKISLVECSIVVVLVVLGINDNFEE